jgi:serine phosphatase RsbU (regulator of sigma subunit)
MSTPLSFVLTDGASRTSGTIAHFPFTVGRLPENDLVLPHPYVSRRHAELVLADDGCCVVDLGSSHGTFINGKPAAPRQLLRNSDTVTFGALDGPSLQLAAPAASIASARAAEAPSAAPEASDTSTIRAIIDQIPDIGATGNALEKMRWFFESARKLKTSGAVDQILAALLDTTLQLTQVERGYVFLRTEAGTMQLALGRDNRGEALTDESTLSHGAMRQAIANSNEYIVTDTLSADPENRSASIIAHSIRSVICIPLRKRRPGVPGAPAVDGTGSRPGAAPRDSDLLGLLYLDSRLKAGRLDQIDSDLLSTIATDAAALIDNAQLAVAEERERRYREEMNIAADIQRGLMPSSMPTLSWAAVAARSIACREVGGDFFDVIEQPDSLAIVLADISGKGISAALLASSLQGLIYSQLAARQPLATIAEVVNRYICSKNIEKYATMAILRLTPQGEMEYINCGHVPPYFYSGGCSRLPESNLPVGLIEAAPFTAGKLQLSPGARVLIVTDGVTEAQNTAGDFYGEAPLACEAYEHATLDEICTDLQGFCGTLAADDDCTLVDLRYLGPSR